MSTKKLTTLALALALALGTCPEKPYQRLMMHMPDCCSQTKLTNKRKSVTDGKLAKEEKATTVQKKQKNTHFKPSTSAPEARYAARREDKDTERHRG